MISDLMAWVSQRLDADGTLSEDAQLLILAALEGKDELADMVGYARPTPTPSPKPEGEPVGAFLKQIKVRGFRGIGPEAKLDLSPSPSLTVISGRNGSGKSSFAEALELALTGTTYRWKARSSQWKDKWRNIHNGDETAIEVTLAEEGVGPTRVSVTWPPGAELEGRITWLQRLGEKKQAGTESLGWAGPLETYRPILTYEEIGAVLSAEPSVLYDALSTVLGLTQVTEAVKALDAYRKATSAPGTALSADIRELRQDLQTLDDERARRASALLAARILDVDELRGLATGRASDATAANRLRALSVLEPPSETECHARATALRDAVQRLAQLADQASEALERRTRLVTAAIDLHEHDGDQLCPVCAVGTLDAVRADALHKEMVQAQEELSQLRAARGDYTGKLNAARSLVSAVPSALSGDLPEALAVLAADTAAAWSAWTAAPDEPLDLADHLVSMSAPVRQTVEALRAAAKRAEIELDEAWTRVAARLAALVDAAEKVEAGRRAATAAARAYKWLQDNERDLKNERLKPIAAEARAIWAGLRAESDVELAGLTLESTKTRRHVEISAQVGGADAGALAVMSQGELHSLALALFLPRATMPQSPFRFVVLDDPVQAMDPAKVDGLVSVLLDIARTRQVIVFSHDDRFASAVRRAPKTVPVTMLEVVREAGSNVSVSVTWRPAERYLRDAFGLAGDTDLPEETLRRVLPGLLRMALEAQARETYFDRELSRGSSHEVVDLAWDEAKSTRARLALALADPSAIDRWLSKQDYRSRALKEANAIHSTLTGDPTTACRHVEKTVRDVREGVL